MKLHPNLNYSKSVIKYDLNFLDKDERINKFNGKIKDIQRIKTYVDKLTYSYIVIFPELTEFPPGIVKVGSQAIKVLNYTPNPMRCYKCLNFSHPTTKYTKLMLAILAMCIKKHTDEKFKLNLKLNH